MTDTAFDEIPVFFNSGSDELFGVVTTPRAPNGVGVLLAWGNGRFPSSGLNMTRTRLARDLAVNGFTSIRFDYAGISDSGGDHRGYDLFNLPVDDIVAAAGVLHEGGAARLAMVSHCFGGRAALLALDQLPRLEALAMVAPPLGGEDHRLARVARQTVRSQAAALLRPTRLRKFLLTARGRSRLLRSANHKVKVWRSELRANDEISDVRLDPRVTRAIRRSMEREVKLLWMWGTDDDFFDVFQEAIDSKGAWRDMASSENCTIEVVAGRLHGISRSVLQSRCQSVAVEWLTSVMNQRVVADSLSRRAHGNRRYQ